MGVPSILVGIFVFTFLVLPFKQFNAFAGSVALAVIMVPVIMRTTEEILKLVPGTLREASLALGIPIWRTVLSVVIPTGLSGILTGLMLAVARAMGETAPLLFTALGSRLVNVGDFGRPMDALPMFIYVNARQPYEALNQQAWGAAFLLLAFVLVDQRPGPLPHLGPASRLRSQDRACDHPRAASNRRPCRCPRPAPRSGAAVPTGPAAEPAARTDAARHDRDPATCPPTTARFRAVRDVSMTIRAHAVTAIIGPSGCGKSTFLRSLNRMHELIPGARVDGHLLPGRHRPLRPERGPGAAAPGRRHGVPAAEPVPDDVDLRQRGGRPAPDRAPRRARCSTRPSSAASARPRCGTRSRTSSSRPGRRSRAASSSGCASPGPWRWIPR